MVSYNHILNVELGAVTTEPVTLQEVKTFAGIDFDDADDLIEDVIIPAARALCEDYTGISFAKREVTVRINNQNGMAYLPYGPVGDVTFTDDDGEEITGEVTEGEWKQIISPVCSEVNCTYNGGYETLPAELKMALLNACYFLYDNRSESGLSPTSKSILKQYRRV